MSAAGEAGTKIDLICEAITKGTCFHAGIVVRFMNGNIEGNGIRDPMSANNLIQQVCTAADLVDYWLACFCWHLLSDLCL